MHINILQSNVHRLQASHTKLTKTHKTLVLRELQQIVIIVSFIHIETEKYKDFSKQCIQSNSYRLGTHNIPTTTSTNEHQRDITCMYQLPWNLANTRHHANHTLNRICETIHDIPVLKTGTVKQKQKEKKEKNLRVTKLNGAGYVFIYFTWFCRPSSRVGNNISLWLWIQLMLYFPPPSSSGSTLEHRRLDYLRIWIPSPAMASGYIPIATNFCRVAHA